MVPDLPEGAGMSAPDTPCMDLLGCQRKKHMPEGLWKWPACWLLALVGVWLSYHGLEVLAELLGVSTACS